MGRSDGYQVRKIPGAGYAVVDIFTAGSPSVSYHRSYLAAKAEAKARNKGIPIHRSVVSREDLRGYLGDED